MDTNKRTVGGFVLILLGVYLLLNNLDMMPFQLPWYFFKWQMILIGIGIFNLFTGNRKGAFVLFSLGILLILPDLFPEINLRDYWPLILIIIGLSFFFRGKGTILTENSTDNILDELPIFGGKEKKVMSPSFEGGKINTIFGGLELDLSESHLSSNGAEIEIFTLFGGTEITVPSSWRIQSSVTPILGGFEDGTGNRALDQSSPLVKIHGSVIFGGVEIKRS